MANLRGIIWLFLAVIGVIALPCASWAQQTPANGDDALKAAEQLFNADRHAEAVRAFTDFQTRFPQHPQAVNAPFNIAESLVQLGEYEQARALLNEYYEVAPTDRNKALALYRLGECSFFLNDFDLAKRHLELFRSQYPNHDKDPYAIGYLGEILLSVDHRDIPAAKKLFQEGFAYYSKAAAKNEQQKAKYLETAQECRLGLGQTHAVAGEIPQAIAIFEQMAKDTKNKFTNDARVRLGKVYYESGRFADAIATLKQFEKAPKSANRNWGLYWLGRSYLDRNAKGDAALSVATLKLVDSRDAPEDETIVAPTTYYLGEAYRRNGELDNAVKRYEKVYYDYAESEWADDAFLSAMRVALERQEYQRVTVDYLATSAQQFTESGLYPYMEQLVGQAFLKSGKFKDAQSTFTNLTRQFPKGDIEPDPKNKDSLPIAFTNDNWLFLALSEIGLRSPDRALAALQKISRDNEESGDDFELAVNAAEANANVLLGRFRDAIAPLQAYLKERGGDSDAPSYFELLARCQIMDNQPAAALRTIEQLRSLDLETIGGEEPILKAEQALAVAAAKQGQKELAAKLYTYLTFPRNPQAYKDFGEDGLARLAEGKPPPSGEVVADGFPVSDRAEEQAAYVLLQEGLRAEEQGDVNRALENFKAIYTEHRNSEEAPMALLSAGRINDREGNDKEAAILLTQLVSEYANFPQLDLAWYRLGWTLVESDDLEGSQNAFRNLVDTYHQSALWADAAYRVAEFESQKGNRDEANRLLDDILRHADAERNPTKLLDHVLYLRAQNALVDKKWTVVEGYVTQLIEETPNSPLALSAQYLAAEAAYKNRQFDQAQKLFAALAKDAEGRTESWLPIIPLRQAQILAWRGGEYWRDAYDAAVEVKTLYPDFDRMHEVEYLLGRCQSQLGKFSEARKHYTRVIELDRGKRGESAAMSQWMIGETYFRQGGDASNYKKAIDAYDEVRQRYRYPYWQSAALLQIGKCYLHLGNEKLANAAFDDLIANYPTMTFAQKAKSLRKASLNRSAASRGGSERFR
jgi:TolA-binding protein